MRHAKETTRTICSDGDGPAHNLRPPLRGWLGIKLGKTNVIVSAVTTKHHFPHHAAAST